jgi:AAA domain-containing protein
MSAPIIYRLAIERFRCITSFSWHPAKGVNLILGGGDVGKTTILDAMGLLLSPTNPLYTFAAEMRRAWLRIATVMRLPRIWAVPHRRFPGEHSSFA